MESKDTATSTHNSWYKGLQIAYDMLSSAVLPSTKNYLPHPDAISSLTEDEKKVYETFDWETGKFPGEIHLPVPSEDISPWSFVGLEGSSFLGPGTQYRLREKLGGSFFRPRGMYGIDSTAKNHDLAYTIAGERLSKGLINREQYSSDLDKADEEMITVIGESSAPSSWKRAISSGLQSRKKVFDYNALPLTDLPSPHFPSTVEHIKQQRKLRNNSDNEPFTVNDTRSAPVGFHDFDMALLRPALPGQVTRTLLRRKRKREKK